MIHKNRGTRRKTNVAKALRKARIIKKQNNYWHYTSLHELSKGKIHCSCPICSAKTNDKNNKSHGPIDENKQHSSRFSSTHCRYGRKNWKYCDRKKIDNMKDQINKYTEGEENVC